ncbi:hypothetical protein SBDP1_1170023 [Syntrophobacter sp. SbD1]|nr:hypothetical protein SBDP1_1170023 [Syntrophobacter sp. SbD1]
MSQDPAALAIETWTLQKQAGGKTRGKEKQKLKQFYSEHEHSLNSPSYTDTGVRRQI